MSIGHLIHVTGTVLLAVAVALAAAGGVALVYGDGDAAALFGSSAIAAAIGYTAKRSTTLTRDLTVREGYAVVSLVWMAVGAVGALPYLLAGVIESPVAAVFESVSGFTTTGATVLSAIEGQPRGILFWRSLTQWLGGMGIIVLGIAILPFLGIGGMQLFRAEVPGPTPERLQPRIAQTAKLLWYVYAGLTAMQVLLYLLGGTSLYDAVTHAFTTLSTGGFSPNDDSIAAFSPFIQYVTIVFMYLAGVNFALHYRFLTTRGVPYTRDAEWRYYSVVLAGSVAIVLLVAAGTAPYTELGSERAFRDALFQVVSIGTTTGYVNYDYELWPLGAQLVLLLLMFMGGMAGSTAGGMKAMRVGVLFRHGLAEMKKAVHPRAVVLTRIGRKPVREDVLANIFGFVLFYMVLFAAGVLVLAVLDFDLATAIGAAAATIGNIGPGIGEVGAVDNYAWMGAGPQLLLIFLMIAGRLEIFTVLLLFHPDLWRRAAPH